jgi:hypothetical protein
MYTDPRWNESWADNSIGQVVTVTGKSGNVITVDPPVRHTYRAALYPRIRTQGFVENAGVEDLHIKLTAAGDPTTIQIKNSAYCWVRNCHLEYTSRTHVSLSTAYKCEIRRNYMHHAHDYGGGGHGYGVNAGGRTSDCLIEDNIFEHLRHSMLVQVGANGNVFGYNYSLDNYTDASWTPCDISLHGHWPYMNLFEGNVVQEIDVSDYWGPCGPGNTFLRNRIETEGFDVFDYSHEQNFIGNELPVDNIHIDGSINNTLVHGNHEQGSLQGYNTISDHNIPVSYYLMEKPAFFGSLDWPVTGGEIVPNSGKIPAQLRYEGNDPVECDLAGGDDIYGIECFPNPFNGRIAVSCQLSAISKKTVPIKIYDVKGKLVKKLITDSRRLKAGITWNTANMPSGIYVLKCRINKKSFTKQLVLQK